MELVLRLLAGDCQIDDRDGGSALWVVFGRWSRGVTDDSGWRLISSFSDK